MKTMKTRPPSTWLVATLTIFTMVSLVGRASAGPTPAQRCQAAKNTAASKYGGCRQTAEASFAVSGNNAKHDATLMKCLGKYQAKWLAIEAKARGACPSVGDQAAIQGVIAQNTTSIAAALGGVVLDCTSDLTTCQVGGAPGQRLRTGQTTCSDGTGAEMACAGSGQDGELQKGLGSAYTDNGNGTITDRKTGLMWEKLSDDSTIHDKDDPYNWTDAQLTKVAMLNATSFAGFNDWRLPNVNELQSLVNYGVATPTIDVAFNTNCETLCTVLTCSCTPFNRSYWSSSSYRTFPKNAWYVNFFDGSVKSDGIKTAAFYVRAVRDAS